MKPYFCIIAAAIASDIFGLCYSKLHRNVTIEQAPGCRPNFNEYCDVNLFHIKAEGPNDTLHYLWDFTSKPSFLLARTSLGARLKIDWPMFMSGTKGALKIKPSPEFSLIVILDKLVEYDDADDTGFIKSGYKNVSYDLDAFTWELSQGKHNVLDSPVVEVKGKQRGGGYLPLNGSVIVQLAAFCDENHDAILPRLLHTANSSQARVYLEGLSSDSSFNQTRWAINLVFASSFPNSENFEVDIRKNLDDENSPGVFSVVDLLTPTKNITNDRGYLHWRPVAYTAAEPSVSNSSDVAVLEPSYLKEPMRELNGSLAYKFYGSHLTDILVQHTIVSFGSSQDGFYKKTNFTSWAFLISYGIPQTDTFSMLVLLVMGIGLGLPALLVICGGLFLCIRRFARHSDELSLE